MKISELDIAPECKFISLKCKFKKDIDNFIPNNGKIEMVDKDTFSFITNKNIVEFEITDDNAYKVVDYFNRHYVALGQIIKQNKKSDFFFLYAGFFHNFQKWEKVPIILSDKVIKKLERRYRFKKFNRLLDDNFKLSDGINSYFAYKKSNSDIEEEIDDVEENLENNVEIEGEREESAENDGTEVVESEEISDTIETERLDEEETLEFYRKELEKLKEKKKNKRDMLLLYGKNFDIYASLQGEGIEAKLCAEEIKFKRNEIPTMALAQGELEFYDHTSYLSKKVRETLEGTKGYLDLWNQYADEEGNLLLEKIRKIGLITIHRDRVTVTEEGIHVPYSNLSKEALDLIVPDSYLYFSKDKPLYLADLNMSWDDYKSLTEEMNKNKCYQVGEQVRVIGKKQGGFILEGRSEGLLPKEEFVSLSIIGDENQIRRREDARKRITTGQAANPALGLILEGKLTEELTDRKVRKKIEPLSLFVKEKIFQHDPTDTQKRAIDIALNTPDIAIIQGPPGTGKTTVITAIVERLNEIFDKSQKISGQVLITSFQHDAVRNVIERLRINSLPTLKFGKQERNGEEDLTRETLVENWCEEYIQKLVEKRPELLETKEQGMLTRLHNMYLAYPSDQHALEFLECAKKVNENNELNERIDKLIETYNLNTNEQSNDLLLVVRRLRVTKEAFRDDGSENAYYLLNMLNKIGIDEKIGNNKFILDVLKEVSLCTNVPNDELLGKLQQVKFELLKKCIPKPVYRKEEPDNEILDIYKELNRVVKKYKDEKLAILANLLHELKLNRTGVEDSLGHYLFVYAATTQQSEGKEIRIIKGIDNKNKHPEYETVIVDEAARVSPVDLMIPLAQAKSRIILVGDHRQLPHIYDEEIFETLKENGERVDINNIKKSMFEYLLEKAKQLEEMDHIPRRITLDAQYRMHPLLGEFINAAFYAPYKENFASPLPAENYSQSISKKPLPLEWYNFPDVYGKEMKKGTSRIRECEADFIVMQIKKYLNSENGMNLSYGVISFYSEQVKLIKRKLREELGEWAEKVRVGSVDAFQGMEFDVIFLSVVRSNGGDPIFRSKEKGIEKVDLEYLDGLIKDNADKESEEYKKWEEYKNQIGIQNFGFLISENRLCVSLSRQKRLLIVVGNKDMFSDGDWGRVAKICVPGMHALYNLCKEKEVIYDGHSESN